VLVARIFLEFPTEALWRYVVVCFDGVLPFHPYCVTELLPWRP